MNKTIPKVRPFNNSVEAAQALEDYFKEVLSNFEYHEIPIVHPGPREPFATDKMHISEIASSCPRLPVLSALMPTEDESQVSSPNGYFISGHLHESYVVGCLSLGHGPELVTQLELDSLPEEVQSHTDVWWPDRNLVIEVKSIGIAARGSSYYPRESALRQAAAYAHYISKEQGEDAEVHAVVVYTFREDPSIIDVFPVPRHLYYEMAMRVEEGVSNYRNRTVPPVPSNFRQDRFPCSFRNKDGKVFSCKLFDVCWANKKDESALEIDDFSARKMVNELLNVQTRLNGINSEKKFLTSKRKDLEKMLQPYFDANATLSTDDPEWNIKRITISGGVDYDLRSGVRRGLIPLDVLSKLEIPKAPYSYTLRVRKTGEEEGVD